MSLTRPSSKQHTRDKKRSMTLAACLRCQRQKIRCDGQRPVCSNCARSQCECLYQTLNAEETRAGAAKREIAQLRSQLDVVSLGLTKLKAIPNEEAIAWLASLRSAEEPLHMLHAMARGAYIPPALPDPSPDATAVSAVIYPQRSPLDLTLSMEHPILYPLLPAVPTDVSLNKQYLAESSSVRDRFPQFMRQSLTSSEPDEHAPAVRAVFCDERLRQLNISYWTTVPIPNDLAAALLSLYLETDHTLLCSFDPDLFVRDLTTNQTQFCSSLLVNSILSLACQTYSTGLPRAANFVEPLYRCAQGLLKAEDHNNSISNVAALFALSLRSISCGSKQELTGRYLQRLVDMAVSMRLFGDNRADMVELGLVNEDMINAYAYAAWGAYNFLCIHTFHYRSLHLLAPLSRYPLLPVPGDSCGPALHWSFKPPPPYMDQTFVMYCRLLPILQEVLSVYLDGKSMPVSAVPLAFAEEKYMKLLYWADQVPLSLARTELMPHHAAILHSNFHALVMELFRPFLNRRLVFFPDSRLSCPEDIFLASAERLLELARFYCSRFRDQPAAHTMTCFVIPAYAAQISCSGPSASYEQRRLDFRQSMIALAALGAVIRVREDLVKGYTQMALDYDLFMREEVDEILQSLFPEVAHGHELSHNKLVLDFGTASMDLNSATTDTLSNRFIGRSHSAGDGPAS